MLTINVGAHGQSGREMPHKVVEISLSEADPYWSGALYFAVLAYPTDEERRGRFQQSLIRWTLNRRIEMDREWAEGLQLIRPAYFSGSDELHDNALRQGNKILRRRQVVARNLVLPHLRGLDTGRVHRVKGLMPTVGRMLTVVADELGIDVASVATIASRDWRPLKPVAHAVCAFMIWDNILWEMWDRKPDVDRQLAFLMLPEYVAEVAEIAEHFRSQLCDPNNFKKRDDFRIREEDTIQIVTRWTEAAAQSVAKSARVDPP